MNKVDHEHNLLSFLQKNKFSNLLFLLVFFIATFFIVNNINTGVVDGIRYSGLINDGLEMSSDEIREQYYSDIKALAASLRSSRSFEGFNNGDTRHALRWLYRTLEGEWYEFIVNLLHYNGVILITLTNVLYVGLSYWFTFLSVTALNQRYSTTHLYLSGFLFFTLFVLILSNGMQDVYTFVEMLAVASGLYFALKKKFLLFLLAVALGVVNRESGLVIPLIYIIFNHRQKISYLLPVYGLAVILAVNIDLVFESGLYNPTNYMALTESYSLQTWFKDYVLVGAFLLCFCYPFYWFLGDKGFIWREKRLFLVTMLYMAVGLLGTSSTSVFCLLLCVPSLICLVSRSISEKVNLVEQPIISGENTEKERAL